jgi:transcriptional regulator with XRE-family HTH domain
MRTGMHGVQDIEGAAAPQDVEGAAAPQDVEGATSAQDVKTQDSRNKVNLALGGRLRALRQELGMSLSDVEQSSDGVLNAVVMGSYERGDRTVSVVRLDELATFYGVLPEDLVADLQQPVSIAARLAAALRAVPLETQVSDWHEPDSGARGVHVRMTSSAAVALLAHLEAAQLEAHHELSTADDGTDEQ